MKCYWMFENARVTAFTVSELLGENQHGGGGGVKITSPPSPRLGSKESFLWYMLYLDLMNFVDSYEKESNIW